MVIGLETHVELATKTKIFCGCSTEFGGDANTQCCENCTGMPGTLPTLNATVVEYAAKAGLALGCEIKQRSIMSRKHYVYPDLAKAYQITQYDKPICLAGKMELSNGRTIGITRIHIEEDAGKLVHVGRDIRMDDNRAGMPLIEIVTEPDFRSAGEVLEYMERLQTALRAIGVSDCRMQEGSMRCDVNISLRPLGEDKLGVRTETKNLNSFTAIESAIEFEYERHLDALENGGTLIQETRGFDSETGETTAQRDKENADDYRYFTEPDLFPVLLTAEDIERIRASLPEMPEQKLKRYTAELGVAEFDAKLLTKYRAVSEYFEAASEGLVPKSAATFMTTTMFAHITTEAEREYWNPTVKAEQLRDLLGMMESGKINRNMAKRVYQQMAETGKDASAFISAEDLAGFSSDELEAVVRAAIAGNEKSVADYKAGKEKALKAIVGAVMRETKGRADAIEAENLILQLIS